MAKNLPNKELEQRVKMSVKKPIKDKRTAHRLCGCVLYIFIVIVNIFNPALAQDQVQPDAREVAAAVPKDFPPYYVVDESGEPAGFAIDVMDRIAAIAGLRVTYLIDDSWTKVAESVKSGRADLIPNIGITASRKAWLDYTAPVEIFPISIFVCMQTYNIKGVEDLSGRKVGAVKFNVGVALLQERGSIDLKIFHDARGALFELLAGHVDALVYPAPVLMKMARESGVDHRVKIVGKPLIEIKRAIAVSKGNIELLKKLNQAVNRFVGTTEYQEIYVKWFGKPRPFWTALRVLWIMGGIIVSIIIAMVLWRYNSISKINRRLTDNITRLIQAQDRIKHLNLILSAIRGVNQLIVKENDRYKLIQGACDNLIKTRGYHSAWIALVDEGGRLVTAVQAGVDSGFPAMIDKLKLGELTRCMRMAVDQSGVLVVADPAVECGDCPLVGIYAGKARLIARLEHEGSVFGFLTVTVPAEMAGDEEERWLFEEVAGDVAFALHDMELEEEHKKTGEALKEAQRYTRGLIEASLDALVTISAEGKITDVNHATELITGMSRKEIIGTDFSNYFTDPDAANKSYQKVFQDRYVRDYPLEIKHRDGKITPVLYNASVYKDTQGRVAGVFAAARDMTEQKQAEEEIRKLSSAVEQSIDGIAISDLEERLTYVNDTFARMHGYSPDELIGMKIEDLHNQEQMDSVKKILKQIMTEGSWIGEIEHIRKDGTPFATYMSDTLMKDDYGKPISFLAVVKDITEQKKLESQLQQAQKMEAIGTLAGGIAHDFNNILAAIIGYTEIADLQVPEDNKAKESLKEVLKAGRRATDLVKQILAFSRKGELERIPVQINPIVKEALKLLRSTLPTTVEIRQNIESDTGIVEADPTQIHQILMNLCTNAAHAMREEGGVLEVGIRDVEVGSWDSELGYLDMTPGPYLLLTVSDTGEGMTPEILGRIFDPYFTTKEKGVGTGLGLAVVHGIVKNYGGTIRAYSEPGKGTTFHVYLPRTKEAKEMAEDESRPGVIPIGQERVLFIDDEPVLVDIGKQMLERLGYEVTTRTSSIEALELFRVKPDQFDLVITDMTMPNMTGDKLSRELMQIRPDIPIIICTGFSERITEEKAKGMGIKAFAMKPIVIRDLANTVREVLEGGKEKPAEGLILVVDDDDQLRGMLREMLERAGYEVADAPNGKEGIRLYRENPADLVVTDLIMPEKEGIETIIELRREFQDVKIIAMSGGGTIEAEKYLKMAKRVGADRTFVKPVEREELLKAVREVLDE